MADERQNPNDPSYDWLYSGQQAESEGSSDDATDGAGDEATRVIPQPPPPPPPPPPAADDESERTQLIDVPSDKPKDAPTEAAPDASSGTAIDPSPGPTTQLPQDDKPQSFGGTFPAPSGTSTAPPPSDAPRFAQPSQSYQTAPATARPGQPPPPLAAPAKPKRRRNWWLRGILILLVLWVVFMIAIPIWAWKRIDKVDAEPSGDRPSDTSGTTYLLVGSDSREGLSKEQNGDLGTGGVGEDGGRTDTIILMHVPSGGGPTLMLSIPRDSYVDIPGHGKNKINAAYAFGGPDLLVQTVEEATDVRIDDYIEVGFSGFVDIVDAVGGITVCPKEKIDDPKAGNLKMSKGCQEVDGTTALKYSRSRAFALGDITRAEHQREVIGAVGSKAASWKTILLPWRYFSVAKAGSDSVAIGENVGPFALVKFAWAMGHSGDAKKCVVPYSDLGASTSAGSAVIWDDDKADAIFKDIRNDNTSGISCSATGQ